MPVSYGILAFRRLPEERSEKCLVQPLKLPECVQCLSKLDRENRFLYPNVHRHLEKHQIQLLCILRRDTHALVDLLRGKYPGERYKEQMVSTWLKEITCMEQSWLNTMSFDQLWNMMFRRRPSGQQEQMHSQLVMKSQNLVDTNKSHFPFAEFGIPKGRMDKTDQSYLDCAIREFEEETNYKRENLDFGPLPYRTITEDFVGTNGIHYIHIYYIAEIDASLPIPAMTPSQLGEIQNVGWFLESEIMSVLRPYDYAKREVIRSAFQEQAKTYKPRTETQ